MIRTAAAALTMIASTAVVVSMPAPANACLTKYLNTNTSGGLSQTFNASSSCNGAWALSAAQGDYIKGQYDKSGWQDSTLGWQWVVANGSDPKIVGDTVPGRTMRGISATYYQQVRYKF